MRVVSVEQATDASAAPAVPKGLGAAGRSFPLGATVFPAGVNFCVYSRNASGVELVFFEREDDLKPSRVIKIDPAKNRTFPYWHVFIAGVKTGQLYGYRVSGPFDPANGMRFDPDKLLLDPYGLGVAVLGITAERRRARRAITPRRP